MGWCLQWGHTDTTAGIGPTTWECTHPRLPLRHVPLEEHWLHRFHGSGQGCDHDAYKQACKGELTCSPVRFRHRTGWARPMTSTEKARRHRIPVLRTCQSVRVLSTH